MRSLLLDAFWEHQQRKFPSRSAQELAKRQGQVLLLISALEVKKFQNLSIFQQLWQFESEYHVMMNVFKSIDLSGVIIELITRNPELTRSLDTLVLCPSHLEAEIRPALTSIGYAPTHERLAFERDRFYEVIVAHRATAPISPVDPIRAAWGPRLFEHHDPLLRAFLEDAKRRFHAAFKEDLRSYLTSELKAALGHKLATLDAALALI